MRIWTINFYDISVFQTRPVYTLLWLKTSYEVPQFGMNGLTYYAEAPTNSESLGFRLGCYVIACPAFS